MYMFNVDDKRMKKYTLKTLITVPKKAGVALLISGKVQMGTKKIARYRGSHPGPYIPYSCFGSWTAMRAPQTCGFDDCDSFEDDLSGVPQLGFVWYFSRYQSGVMGFGEEVRRGEVRFFSRHMEGTGGPSDLAHHGPAHLAEMCLPGSHCRDPLPLLKLSSWEDISKCRPH